MRKTLIADDHARTRQMVRQIVTGLASPVYEAADGGEAVAVCTAERPDQVLMGLRMNKGSICGVTTSSFITGTPTPSCLCSASPARFSNCKARPTPRLWPRFVAWSRAC